MKRITFTKRDAQHLYELSLEHFCVYQDARYKGVNYEANCGDCERIKERLEEFIGKPEVRTTQIVIRKNGYCNKLKGR